MRDTSNQDGGISPVQYRRATFRAGHDEVAILQHLAVGDSVDKIAQQLGYSPRTIRRRIQALHIRFGTTSRDDLVGRVKGVT